MILAHKLLLAASLILLGASRAVGVAEPQTAYEQIGHPILVERVTIDTLFFGVSFKETWKIWDPILRRWEYKTRVRW